MTLLSGMFGGIPKGIEEKTYRAIGRFMYEFSQTEFTLRHCLGEEIKLNEKHFDAVIQSYDVGLLCNVSKRVFETSITAERYAAAEKLINSFQKLNGERQRVAHGLWIPHFQGGMVHHVSRTNLKSKRYEDQAKLLEKLADEASQIRQELFKLFSF